MKIENYKKVKIYGVGVNKENNVYFVVLLDTLTNKIIQIFIGAYEAQAISMGLKKIKAPRPLTHDLIINIIESLHQKISKILITKIEHQTYYANINLIDAAGKEIEIDARPSDCLAVASKLNVPIYVHNDVFNEAGQDASLHGINIDRKDQVVELEQELEEAVVKEEYEKAAELRDKIKALKEKQKK